MSIKSFSHFFTEETKEVIFTFGRFNPPTIGHEKLMNKLASLAKGGASYRVYASQSQDPKKNPLSFKDKVKFMRKMFPKHARSIMADSNIRNVFDVLVKLYDQGFNQVTMVVGSDRVKEFEALTSKYNGVKARHGFFNFENGVNIVSAGDRDPDAEGATGMSASKMRAAASDNNFSEFSKGLPRGYKEGEQLFNAVRTGMGLKESTDTQKHIHFDPISEKREAYVQGELFAEGDIVVVNESDEVGQVIMLGSNYVLVEMADGRKVRKWLDDVELIEEKDERKKDSPQDSDIKDLPGSQPKGYYKGVDKDDKEARAKQFKKQAKMDDDNPAAYKPAPGDKDAKTKPSKHTKKYKQMYGEESSYDYNITESTKKALQKKADKTGMPYSILKKVFDRGVAAWRTGHRPGTTPAQWGLARVNSFVTKSKGTWGKADKDLAAKVRGK